MGKSIISITIFDSYDCLPEGISYPVVFNIASIAMKHRPSKDDYHGDSPWLCSISTLLLMVIVSHF